MRASVAIASRSGVLIGALAFVGLLWFLGNNCGGSGNNGGAHVGGHGLNGYAGIAQMLEAEGLDVVRQRNRRASRLR